MKNIQHLEDLKRDLERYNVILDDNNKQIVSLNSAIKKIKDKIKGCLNRIKVAKSLFKKERIHIEELKQLVIKFNKKTKDKIAQDIKKNKQYYDDVVKEISDLVSRIEDNVETFFDNVFKTISGVYFGIIGLLIFTISTSLSVMIYLFVDPNYSIYTNWILTKRI